MIDPLSAKLLRFVADVEELNQVDRTLRQIISYRTRSSQPPDLLISKVANWIAVPILDPFYLIASTLLKRLKLILLEDDKQLFAVTLPQYGLPSFTYNVPLIDDALREIEILSPFITILFSETPNLNWIFLSIETDYCIMIGLSEFINDFLEHKIEERFSQLHTQILLDERNSEPLSESYYPYLSFIYDQLRKYNDAETGEQFSLIF